jgi:hypothetical protein
MFVSPNIVRIKPIPKFCLFFNPHVEGRTYVVMICYDSTSCLTVRDYSSGVLAQVAKYGRHIDT